MINIAMLYYVLVFTFGAVVGSFLNVVIYRLRTNEPIIKARSHCPKCGHVLSWRELIPVISFLVQKGKCRACKKSISPQYPIVEIGTAVMFVLIFHFKFFPSEADLRLAEIFNEFLNLGYLLIIASLLIIIFVYDFKHYIIPDKILYPAIGLAVVYQLFEILLAPRSFSEAEGFGTWEPFVYSLISGTGALAFFLTIYFATKGRGLGFGDVKFAFFMGLFLGWPNILAGLFISWILGGIIGIGLLIAGRKNLKSQIPFGPFLVAGTFAAMLWGEEIVGLYLDFLGI